MKSILLKMGVAVLTLSALASNCRASDHADPMSLNVFQLQDAPAANITDLHAFLVDAKGVPVLTQQGLDAGNADQLIVSLCVRRRLLPGQIDKLESNEHLTQFSFRVHLDLNPDIRFFHPAKTRAGEDYEESMAKLDAAIPTAAKARDEARAKSPPKDQGMIGEPEKAAQRNLDELIRQRSLLVDQHQADAAMQRLYGGLIDTPSSIAEEAILDYRLVFTADGENSEASLDESRSHIQGIPGKINVVTEQRKSLDQSHDITRDKPWREGEINVRAGVFDDPFIFPRFYRSNVVGIVTSIPLKNLHRPDGALSSTGPILLWATTHLPDGQQSDHVGRSLRTQLPRFGYLNELHPSAHVATIMRVHGEPTLMENFLAVGLAPLEAHRHYDNAPDVMIYDLTKPARFPNGRWLADDVSQTLANAGETLLYELCYAESRQVPRATINDKPFRATWPYLAPRWKAQEVLSHTANGTHFGEFDMGESSDKPEAHNLAIAGTQLEGLRVPDAGDSAAIAPPDLNLRVWKSLWLGMMVGLIALGVVAYKTTRSPLLRCAVLVIAISSLCSIYPLQAERLKNTDPNFAKQPITKINLLLGATGVLALFAVWSLVAIGIRQGIKIAAAESLLPLGEQTPQQADYQYDGSSFNEVYNEVFKKPYYGVNWGEENSQPLPVYQTTAEGVARGMFSLTKRFLFLDAAQRTLTSHADLRYGNDGKGVERLIHPNGVCLAGVWKIREDAPTDYTGYFAKGSEGLVITRYSTGLKVLRGEKRTLSMVGKLYPTMDQAAKRRTASFITQEDLGAAYSNGIHDAVLRNAPNITITKRFPDLATLFLFAFTFNRADTRNSERQLYEIAELGLAPGSPTRCPRFMQLTINQELSPKIGGGNDTADFRHEVLAQIYDRGVKAPARSLVFDIEVSDQGEVTGFLNKGITNANWKNIGTLTFDHAVASRSGDFVIHFHHPKWRNDRNQRGSETGPSSLSKAINKTIAAVGNVFSFFRSK